MKLHHSIADYKYIITKYNDSIKGLQIQLNRFAMCIYAELSING